MHPPTPPGCAADAVLAALPAASRRALRLSCRAARGAVDARVERLGVASCQDALPAAAPRLLRLRELSMGPLAKAGARVAADALGRLPAPLVALRLTAADEARWANPSSDEDLGLLADAVANLPSLRRVWLRLSAKHAQTGCASLLAAALRAPMLESLSLSLSVDRPRPFPGLRLPTQLRVRRGGGRRGRALARPLGGWGLPPFRLRRPLELTVR
jgi:hypothetical protein